MKEKRKSVDVVVGRNLRIHRLAKGLSQTELADELGITSETIQKYEKGKIRVPSGRLFEISVILGVTVLALFEGSKRPAMPVRVEDLKRFDLVGDALSLRLVHAFLTKTGRRVIPSPAKSKTDVTTWSDAFDTE